jgi:hypothetical protein
VALGPERFGKNYDPGPPNRGRGFAVFLFVLGFFWMTFAIATISAGHHLAGYIILAIAVMLILLGHRAWRRAPRR